MTNEQVRVNRGKEETRAGGRDGRTSNTHNKKKIYSEAQTARKYWKIRHKEKAKRRSGNCMF